MSETTNNAGGYSPEMLSDFGLIPPALFASAFEVRRFTLLNFSNLTSVVTLPNNANRWAWWVGNNAGVTPVFAFDRPDTDLDGYLMGDGLRPFSLSFRDVGTLVTQATWLWVASSGTAITGFEIIFNPRCHQCA